MGALAHTFITDSAVGIREDLSDVISNIAPTMTPFITSAGMGPKAKQTRFDWQLDTLDSAGTNAFPEGDDVTFADIVPTSKVSNIVQISRKAFLVSDTEEEVDKAGRKSEIAYQIAKAAKALKRDVEYVCLSSNQPAKATDTRTTASMLAFVNTNVSDGGGAAAGPGGPTNGLYLGTRTSGTDTNFTEDRLKTVLQAMYTVGGEVESAVILVHPVQKVQASTFDGIATPFKTVGSGQATVVGAVDVYVSDFGTLSIAPDRFQRDRDAWILDYNLIRLKDLRPYKVVNLAKTGDAEKRFLRREWGLQVDNQLGLGLVTDCDPTPA
jgi:hypothetical protein